MYIDPEDFIEDAREVFRKRAQSFTKARDINSIGDDRVTQGIDKV